MFRFCRRYVAGGLLVLGFTATALAKDAPTHDAVKPTSRDGGWMKRHESINAAARKSKINLVFIGDSITEGWANNDIWKKHYTPRKALNAGISGDRTQHVLWRLDHGNIDGIKPKLVVLMIGTNNASANKPREIADGISEIVAILRQKLPKSRILVLGVFPRGADGTDSARQVCMKANAIIKKLDDGKMVHYLDIGPKFLNADGTLPRELMPDLLHLSLKGYQIWAEAIEGKVAELMGERKESKD